MYNLIEYSSNYSERTRSLSFCSKDEATDFNEDIANTDDFKSFKYKVKLLENCKVQPALNEANGILKNATIDVLLKYLSNFWRSLENPLINCKVELKFKWTRYCVLSAAGNDNDNDDYGKKIIFTIKDTKLYVPVVTLSARDNQNFLAKDLKDQFIGMNIKQKARIKIRQMSLDIFSNQILLESINYLY